MDLKINWQEPNEVRKLIKTLELTHPYQSVQHDGTNHIDNIKYLEAQIGEHQVMITLFKEPTSEHPEKLIVETKSQGIAYDVNGNELDYDIEYKEHDIYEDIGGSDLHE